MIAFLSVISLRRFEGFQEAIDRKEIPGIEMPEITFPEFNLDELAPVTPLTPEQIKENYKIFISPNQALKIKYPANWQTIDNRFLEQANQRIEEYNLTQGRLLFFAYEVRLAEHPPVLIVQELSKEKELEEIIGQVKGAVEKEGGKLTILKRETKNRVDYFEARHERENHVFYLKGGLVSAEERNYLIMILVSSQLKEGTAPQTDFILNSIQLLE